MYNQLLFRNTIFSESGKGVFLWKNRTETVVEAAVR